MVHGSLLVSAVLSSATSNLTPTGASGPDAEAQIARNLLYESGFNLLSGVHGGMIAYASLVVAKTCLQASPSHLALLLAAFPCGAFLGSLWASLGRRWGMQRLVMAMNFGGSLPLLAVPWVTQIPGLRPADGFTALMTVCLLLYSAMKMGQSSMYRATYPAAFRGRAVGQLLFCNYLAMVLTILVAGWLVDERWNDPTNYRWLYPLTAVAGLGSCWFYGRIRPMEAVRAASAVTVREAWKQVGDVLSRDRDFRWFQLSFFLNGSAFFMASHVVVELCRTRLHFDAVPLALAMGVVPLAVLAVCSPIWGRVLDRLGIVMLRVLVATAMTCYLACYFLGLACEWPALIFVGSVLRGISEGGGQVSWALASVQFAPAIEDVPIYNSIHFTLNGVRGLAMPWVGILLLASIGSWTVFVACLLSGVSIFVGLNLAESIRVRQDQAAEVPAGAPLPGPLGSELAARP